MRVTFPICFRRLYQSPIPVVIILLIGLWGAQAASSGPVWGATLEPSDAVPSKPGRSASDTEAGGGQNFHGLEVLPLNSSLVTLEGPFSLIVSHDTSDAAAQVLTGRVGALETIFDISPSTLATGSGLRIEARGEIDGGQKVLGSLLLESDAEEMIVVTPNFIDVGSPTYSLTLLHQGEVKLQDDGLSGAAAGRVTFSESADQTVEWFSGSLVVLSGFGSNFHIGESSYLADQALFRAKDPMFEGVEINSVSWSGQILDSFKITGLSFDLEGWQYRMSGPFNVSPTLSSLGTFNPDQGGAWNFEVSIESAAEWSIGVETGALLAGGGPLVFTSSANFTAGGTPAQLEISLFGQQSLPPLTGWEASFGLTGLATATYAVEVLNGGIVVDSLSDAAGKNIFFEALDFEVGMALAQATRPGLILSFAAPVSVALDDGAIVLGDQIVASPSTPGALEAVQDLSELQASGLGLIEVGIGQLEVELEQKPSHTFLCGATITMAVCHPGGIAERLEYQLEIEEGPQGQDSCFQIENTLSQALGSFSAFPPSTSGPPYLWQGCLDAGTSCRVGFAADLLTGSGTILVNQATVSRGNGDRSMIDNKNLIAKTPANDLPACSSMIQICDDELDAIFRDGFECGTRNWSGSFGENL